MTDHEEPGWEPRLVRGDKLPPDNSGSEGFRIVAWFAGAIALLFLDLALLASIPAVVIWVWRTLT